MNIADCNRIVVVGNNGSGKSWFSRKLAVITGLPLIHLDREFWLPNWETPTKEDWHARNKAFIAGERWIIDGMCSHGDTMAERIRAADLVIVLDVNRFVCLAGVIKRAGKPRPDMPEYLWASRGPRFLKLCKRALTFNTKRFILGLRKENPGTEFLIIKGRREMNLLLKELT